MKISSDQSLRTVNAVRIDKGPKMDGILDDVVWKQAQPIEGFVQRDPGYWIPATERTVARILYDDKQIYFGFECYDSAPNQIVANYMRRDSELWGDDNVQILLDTYNDKQNGVFFFVNSLGAKRDLVLSHEGRTYNEDWDCIWQAKGHRHNKGWSVEVAIPFDQLRFKKEEDTIWGINLARFIARKTESISLMMGKRSSSPRQRYRTTDLAQLRGLKSLKTKPLFQIKPYALSSGLQNLQSVEPTTNTSFESGMDVRYGITPNMTLDLSYNTDFAQVEGDQEQVNLTQFQLFFSEKREFFLEGSTLFDFGESSSRRGGDIRPPTLLFYSRQVGLEEGQPIPILLGTKLSGKTSKTSVGLLNVLTEPKTINNSKKIPRSNFSIVRVKQDVLVRSNIGAIVVNKQTQISAEGRDTYNRAGGLDFSVSPSNSVNFQGFYARTWDSEIREADDARFLQGTYTGSVYSGSIKFIDIEENFQPKAGFVNRRIGLSGFRRYESESRARIPSLINLIHYISTGPRLRMITDRKNSIKFWDLRLSAFPRFNTGDWFRFEVTQTHDVVEQTFRPSQKHPGVVIPEGNYNFTTFRTGPYPSRSRTLRPEFVVEVGTYYTGQRYRLILQNDFRPSSKLSIETDYEINLLRLPEDNLNMHVLSNRLIYSLTTDFYLKLFTQWNNERQLANLNFLLNYRFLTGSDIYLVYNQEFGTISGLDGSTRALLIKISYLFGL